MRLLKAGVAIALAVSGCQAISPAAKKATGSTTPTTTAATTPATATPGKPVTAPAIVGTPLAGTVKVDASYLVATGAGVIAAGGGNVIAAGGGNVIAPGGGNVIAPGGGNYRVEAAGTVPLGTILPAKGLAVQAFDLGTGKAIGKPVTTDEMGGFKLGVPEDLQNNVLLVASVPGHDDAKLVYPLVVGSSASSALQIDEDSALATRYLRRCMVARFSALTTNAVAGSVDTFLKALGLPATLTAIARPPLEEIQNRAKANGLDKLPQAQREAVCQKFLDAMIAKLDLDKLVVDPKNFQNQGEKEPAIAALKDIMRQSRDASVLKMAAGGSFFDDAAWMKAAVHKRKIEKPTDIGDFMLDEYLTDPTIDPFAKMGQVFATMGMAEGQGARLGRAGTSVTYAIGQILILDKASREEALKIFDEAKAP